MHGRRALLSILSAAALHALLYLVVVNLPREVWWVPPDRVQLDLVELPPPPAPEPVPDPPPSAPESKPPASSRSVPTPTDPVPPEPTPPPPVVEPTAEPIPERPTTDAPLVRLPARDPDAPPPSMLNRVLGSGTKDPFNNQLDDLSGALAFRTDGPLSDRQRAQSRALKNLQSDLAAGEVDRGLADDYLRVLRNHVEAGWAPAKKHLNDGGADLDQLGFMKKAAGSADTWTEMWKAYEKIAGQYARGEQLRLDQKEKQKLRELFRSRDGAFRFTAALEVTVTQAPDGQLLTVDTEIGSGHPGFDEAARAAVAEAIRAMPEPPPYNLHRGGPFKVRWRLRATWRMVPPTALFSGANFDITRKGIEGDIPFDIKLTKRVLLIEYDNRTAQRD